MYNHRKAFSELEFTDDFMFCKILTDNKDLCRELLSGRPVREESSGISFQERMS